MSTLTSVGTESVPERLINNSRVILRQLQPSLTPDELECMAINIAKYTHSIISSSSTLAESQSKLNEIRAFCSGSVVFQNTALQFHLQEQNLLNNRSKYKNLSDDSLNEVLIQTMADSIKTAQNLELQKCNTCQVPNAMIANENGSLKKLLLRCSNCKTAMYCSKNCQRRDWPSHKAECISAKAATTS